jgi:hypothetical protein
LTLSMKIEIKNVGRILIGEHIGKGTITIVVLTKAMEH